jgi:carbamate kinase
VSRPALLLALGGNALIRKGQRGSVPEQLENLRLPMAQAARLAATHRLVITHGNGPQVGGLLLMQECCTDPDLVRLPLEVLVAQTQGWIGYMIESTLDSELMEQDQDPDTRLVSLISYVVVDPDDPAFQDPSKPVGPVLSEARAQGAPFPVRRTAKGWRRVVASPRPVTIVEKREIRDLLDSGFVVVCCGGGGIPVVREGRTFAGVDAVIDKDLASAVLAREVGVDVFVIATDVAGASLDYGTDAERVLGRVTAEELGGHLEAGHFPPGSMRPKVEACLEFLAHGGSRAAICSLADIEAAAAGRAGTQVVP